MTIQHFTFKEVFNFGWAKTRQHAWYVICAFIIYGVVLCAVERSGWFQTLVSLLVALSLVSISLVISRNESFDFGTLFDKLRSPKIVIKFLLLCIVYITAVVTFFIPLIASLFVTANYMARGIPFAELPPKLFPILMMSLLLTIPSLIISVRFKFFPYVLLENENLHLGDVIRSTWRLTRGYFWKILAFLLILALVNILGALAFGVGLILTVPISVFAMAHFYRHLAGHHI